MAWYVSLHCAAAETTCNVVQAAWQCRERHLTRYFGLLQMTGEAPPDHSHRIIDLLGTPQTLPTRRMKINATAATHVDKQVEFTDTMCQTHRPGLCFTSSCSALSSGGTYMPGQTCIMLGSGTTCKRWTTSPACTSPGCTETPSSCSERGDNIMPTYPFCIYCWLPTSRRARTPEVISSI